MVSKIPRIKANNPFRKEAMKRYTGKAMEKLLADEISVAFKLANGDVSKIPKR